MCWPTIHLCVGNQTNINYLSNNQINNFSKKKKKNPCTQVTTDGWTQRGHNMCLNLYL